MDDADWLDDLQQERRWREAHYLEEDGPLSDEALRAFPGLRWYDPDPAYRFADLRLERTAETTDANLPATGEDAVRFVRAGTFAFELHSTACTLHVFEPAPGEVDEPYLFIPFTDATSGKETYGGGRYLDLEPNDDDVYELDLNRAYNPYCVFDDSWVCVLPPPENRLAVPVRAGERLAAE